ncbi:MAG: hypothetical protein Q9188_004916 [Gyalolechia gomerana]
MTGSSIPQCPAPDHETLENDHNGHLHARRDDGAARRGKANGCIPKCDGAGGRIQREGDAETKEEKTEESSQKESSNIKLSSLKNPSYNSSRAVVHPKTLIHSFLTSLPPYPNPTSQVLPNYFS